MKKMFTCLLTALGLTTACGLAQQADNYEVDEFQTKNNKTVKIHALVHASIWIEAGDVQIYIDPVTKSGNRKIDYSAMPKADIILVTHEHYDHLDKDAIRQLTQDGTPLVPVTGNPSPVTGNPSPITYTPDSHRGSLQAPVILTTGMTVPVRLLKMNML